MKCPHCGSTKFKVTNVWMAGEIIRRRHSCAQCGRVFHSRQSVIQANSEGRPRKLATGSNKMQLDAKMG